MFLRNVGWHTTDYTSYHRIWYSSPSYYFTYLGMLINKTGFKRGFAIPENLQCELPKVERRNQYCITCSVSIRTTIWRHRLRSKLNYVQSTQQLLQLRYIRYMKLQLYICPSNWFQFHE
jgi:hypothetical protein